MPKKSSDKKSPKYKPSDLVDPRAWINYQSYGKLKKWLRKATQHRIFLPVVIPHNVMPAAYLTQLLIHSEPQTKTSLHTIIPELIKEWGRNDNPQCLDDLLILCGSLNCNEAENTISRIITEKLADSPLDIELRLRALSVLQEIGTTRSLHIFKRYIGQFDYAAVCYRSMYRLDIDYAVTELPDLMTLYEFHSASEQLEDVLKILFKYTLTTPEYVFVLQPLVDLTPPETFLKVLELLHSLDIINDAFFIQLSATSRVKLVKQILKRGNEDDWGRISGLLKGLGVTVDPPVDLWPVTPEPQEPIETTTQPSVAPGQETSFLLNVSDAETVPVITAAELGELKAWAYSRNYEPDDIMAMFDGPEN